MAARPCSYPVSVLKKVITEKRKQKGFNNPSRGVLDNLLDEHRFLLQAEGIHDIGELMGGTVKQKRAVWQRIKAKYHPPVGRLTASQLIQLIYATNKHLKYNYDSALVEHAKKKGYYACMSRFRGARLQFPGDRRCPTNNKSA